LAERFPPDLAVSIDDFRRSDWRSAIDSTIREGYFDMWQSLAAASRAAVEAGRPSEGKVLCLLADACSMRLETKHRSAPFRPGMVWNGDRTIVPEEFTDPDLEFFSQIVDDIDDPWLQARLADLLWLTRSSKNPDDARLAIDAYRAIPLEPDSWIRGGRECWQRAITLAKMLRAGSGSRLQDIELSIIAAFNGASLENKFFALWLAELLLDNDLGQEIAPEIAQKLASLGQEFGDEDNLHAARDCIAASSRWYKRAGNTRRATELSVAVAETYAKEAQARISSEVPSHAVAASLYEKAIQVYRSIPRAERKERAVDDRIAELHRFLSEAGEEAVAEMATISSGPIDISEMIDTARTAVSGRSTVDALAAFADVYQGAREGRIRQFATKGIQEHPLTALFAGTRMSRSGRVVAKHPGAAPADTESEKREAAVWAAMVRDYHMELGLVVQGLVWPALQVLWLEHRIRESDFVTLAEQSPIVPIGRERLFGTSLFAGYEGNFGTAVHLLVPQVEHMVRSHLKAAGAKTTWLDAEGIENELGLSALAAMPETRGIFGEDLTFEIRALFCDSLGPNLRNEVAHGLLDDQACSSAAVAYAWWFGMRLVFKTFWNSRRGHTPDEGGEGTPQSTDARPEPVNSPEASVAQAAATDEAEETG
jgi:hypothetical protein